MVRNNKLLGKQKHWHRRGGKIAIGRVCERALLRQNRECLLSLQLVCGVLERTRLTSTKMFASTPFYHIRCEVSCVCTFATTDA